MGRKSREKRLRREASKQQHKVEPSPATPAASPPAEGLETPSEGTTTSERYLAKLCRRTFLSLWSFPNVYRDQGQHTVGQGKEVCDLLVVFEDHVLIFSDKECEFPNSEDLVLDGTRWYRRAVHKSADQLWGAERWIAKYPNRLFLDAACEHPFPLVLPNPDRMKVHLILVAHGAAKRCKSVLGGSGSLMIMPDTIGPGALPFAVGRVDASKKYIHILDDTSLDILLTTLDTVADLVAYLERKETFIESGRLGSAAGEEELLAFYLADINENDEHDFIIKGDVDRVMIDEGHWTGFSRSAQRRRQVSANRISYAWDALIEHFNSHFSGGRLEYTSDATVVGHEKLMRYFIADRTTRAGTDAIQPD
jgi:hypothetical protein